MSERVGARFRYRELFERASCATTDEQCSDLVAEIEQLLDTVADPADRGRLLMCRARVRSNQWREAAVLEDARAAMRSFERAGEGELAVDAASWAAAHASRVGELSVASDLATRSLMALASIEDDRLRVEIHNRLAIFCVSFLDYDRALEQLEASLAAAERLGDQDKISRQLSNLADCLLLIHRQRQVSGAQDDGVELIRAESVTAELLARATDEFIRRTGTYRLRAEVLCELGRPEEALAELDRYGGQSPGPALTAQAAAIAWVTARCLRLSGETDRALIEADRAVLIAQGHDDDQALMEALEELAASHEAAANLADAIKALRAVNARMWTIHQRQIRQLVQEVWGRADFLRDQATLQSQAAEARRRAEEDALTGIGNRRVLERFIDNEFDDQRQLSLIVVDIDHFKEINDTYGHRIGDAVLRKVGHLLRDSMRAHQVAVRYGGDEFVLGLLGADVAAASSFAERLRRRVEDSEWRALAPGLAVTVSAGVATGARRQAAAVFSAADDALYEAKRGGRNAVVTAPGPMSLI